MSGLLPNRSELTPLRFLERSAEVFPDHVGIIYGDRRSTYAEFAGEAQRLAARIKDRIGPGDRVAFLAPNVPELLVAHFAVPLAGGVLVAINSRLAPPEVEYILNHSGARILFADAELLAGLHGLRGSVDDLGLVVQVNDPTQGDAGDLLATADVDYPTFLAVDDPYEALPWTVEDENAMISINYTSGTTGRPKGVMYSHRGAYLAALGGVAHNGLNPRSVYLWTLPMFHCNGWCAPWAVTGAGGTHVALRAVRGDAIWSAIDTLGVSHLWGAPAVLSAIADAPEAHELEAPLRITTAGAPPSPTIIAAMEGLGVTVVHVYGLTESYGPFTISEVQEGWTELPGEERAMLMARQGVGMIQAESARVVDPQMNDVAADGETYGEVILRGNNIMIGYYKDLGATEQAFAGGWFHTGDLGVMHADRYIEIKDRAKDVIISGGENISSVEVEQAIVSHPAVSEVAVVGVPDEKWGERPRAYVKLRPGAEVSDEELLEHVRERIARYKVPRDVVRVGELPTTSTGKILKTALRDRAEG